MQPIAVQSVLLADEGTGVAGRSANRYREDVKRSGWVTGQLEDRKQKLQS